jgi:hypothetical protein
MARTLTITGLIEPEDIQAIVRDLKMENIREEPDGFYWLYISRESYENLRRDPSVCDAQLWMTLPHENTWFLILYGARVFPYDM